MYFARSLLTTRPAGIVVGYAQVVKYNPMHVHNEYLHVSIRYSKGGLYEGTGEEPKGVCERKL